MTGKRWFVLAMAGLLVVALAVPTVALAQGRANVGDGQGALQDADGDGICDLCGRAAGQALGRGRGMWGSLGMRFGEQGGLVAVVAEELGVERATVLAALNEGQTLADYIVASGGSVDAIVEAFIAQRQATLDQAVEDGRLTEEQAATMVTHMREEVLEHLEGEADMPCLGTGITGSGRQNRMQGRGMMGMGRF